MSVQSLATVRRKPKRQRRSTRRSTMRISYGNLLRRRGQAGRRSNQVLVDDNLHDVAARQADLLALGVMRHPLFFRHRTGFLEQYLSRGAAGFFEVVRFATRRDRKGDR